MATPLNHSVIKAFTVLKAFRDPGEWLTSTELSRRCNLPGASGYRLIQTLEEIGALVRGPRGRYRPGMLLVSLSQNVIIPELLQEGARKFAADLAERLNVTVHVGVLEREMVTYVVKAATPTSVSIPTVVGAQFEAYCSALGKVLLSGIPSDQLGALLREGELVALTPHTITDESELRTQLEIVRDRGYAVDDREFRVDMCCVAVPIRDNQGRTVAAISASENAVSMTPARQAQLRHELMAAAAAIGQKVYPCGPQLFTDVRPIYRGGKQGLGEAA